jgi:pyruvate dehydrogenase E1 component alpha subunit
MGIAEDEVARLDADVADAVNRATETAKASPIPDLSVIDKDVWADGGSAWRN